MSSTCIWYNEVYNCYNLPDNFAILGKEYTINVAITQQNINAEIIDLNGNITTQCIRQSENDIDGIFTQSHDKANNVAIYKNNNHNIFGIANVSVTSSCITTSQGITERILSHKDSRNGYFSSNIKTTFLENELNPNANRYSIIGNLNESDYKYDEGYWKFKLIYYYDSVKHPGVPLYDEIIWIQYYWILDGITLTQWQAKPSVIISTSDDNWYTCFIQEGFLGLGLSSAIDTLLDGDSFADADWWHSVGQINSWNGGEIKGFNQRNAYGTELYIYNGQTYSPTLSPSFSPTVTPTNDPTIEPTFNTNTPSIYPTIDPTNSPSIEPTNKPNNSSVFDTEQPSIYPSINPTNSPQTDTNAPSIYPTIEPTFNTQAPTIEPTGSPITNTFEPTNLPSNSPTFEPKIQPTNASKIVTNSPSIYPTIEPTTELNITTESPTDTKTQLSNNPSKMPSYWIIIIAASLGLICCVMMFLFIYMLTKYIYLQKQNTIKNKSELAVITFNSDISNHVIKQVNVTPMGNSDNKIAAFENEYDDTEAIVEGTETVHQDGPTREGPDKPPATKTV